MFSSNQVLEVSGDLSKFSNQLSEAIRFAFAMYGLLDDRDKNEVRKDFKLIYQITDDGKYVLGQCYKQVPDGWTDFNIKVNIEIITILIRAHLRDAKYDFSENLDGSYEEGFLMKCIPENESSENLRGIKNPYYGIVSFESFVNFYSK
ncbi:MAG: hypothetical protein MJ246_03685 [Clostridia bacterium]|nr:hypothetical protein [Clostridia bacterium]